jgi:hypothetical protein
MHSQAIGRDSFGRPVPSAHPTFRLKAEATRCVSITELYPDVLTA